MLTTLPGWAAHVQYRTSWANEKDTESPCFVTQSEYLALRLVLTCLNWPEAKQLLLNHSKAIKSADIQEDYQHILALESEYQKVLLKKLTI